MHETLRSVLVRPPDAAFGNADPARWHYTARPDLAAALDEHAALVEILHRSGAEVVAHDQPLPDHADALFVHDPVLVTDAGAIILRMGKGLRRGEEEAMAATLATLGVPILARLREPALAEGGDLLWLDRRTLAAGLGYRTNAEGLRQLAAALEPAGVTVVPVPLPHGGGQEACLHLMSLISVLDRDLAVVYLPLLPVPFVQLLGERGVRLVEVPESEFPSMGPNVLALGPRRCLALRGNPITRDRLEAAGCEVHTYRGDELSLKAEGGPTCLTRPIWRSAAPTPTTQGLGSGI
jgi:N-dimethylarginine dimethylaminohydrolase